MRKGPETERGGLMMAMKKRGRRGQKLRMKIGVYFSQIKKERGGVCCGLISYRENEHE